MTAFLQSKTVVMKKWYLKFSHYNMAPSFWSRFTRVRKPGLSLRMRRTSRPSPACVWPGPTLVFLASVPREPKRLPSRTWRRKSKSNQLFRNKVFKRIRVVHEIFCSMALQVWTLGSVTGISSTQLIKWVIRWKALINGAQITCKCN